MVANVSSDRAMMQDQDGVEVSIEIVLDSTIKKIQNCPNSFLQISVTVSAELKPPSSIHYCLNKTDKTKRLIEFVLRRMNEHDDRVPMTSSAGGISTGDVSVAESDPLNEFVCSICDLVAPYEHFSNLPPKRASKKIKFREECYSVMDPFRPPNQRLPLVVGGKCSECERDVCMACSLYYSRRFCVKCVRKYREEFPKELSKEIGKLDDHYKGNGTINKT